MNISVIESDTKTNIFQGDAEEFLSMQDYDSEVEEILNNLESPNSKYIARYDDLIITRCKG